MSELLNLIVLEYKVCDLAYFLDNMQLYEVSWLLPNLEIATKMSFEQTRFISYITAQCQSTKSLKITDIMQFSWDKKEEEKKTQENTKIEANEIERLKKKMERIIEEKHTNINEQHKR